MSRYTRTFLVLLPLLIATFLGLEWLASPSTLKSADFTDREVIGSFRPGKGGQAHLLDIATGDTFAISCGRIKPLCEKLKQTPPAIVEVRAASMGLLGDTWLLSARIEGQELLSAEDMQARYEGSRRMAGLLTLLFMSIAPVFARYLPRSQPA